MSELSDRQLLEAWEHGAGAPALERALVPLAVAWPELAGTGSTGLDLSALEALPLGSRDALLLELYRGTFGPRLELAAACPACGDGVESTLAVSDLLATAEADPSPHDDGKSVNAAETTLAAGDSDDPAILTLDTSEGRLRLTLSPLTTADLMAVAAETVETPSSTPDDDPAAAAAEVDDLAAATADGLLTRSIAAAQLDGEALAPAAAVALLDPQQRAEIEDRLNRLDPLAELIIDLTCPACGAPRQALLDVPTSFWTALTAALRRLLAELAALARSYGWREDDILALPDWRRRLYLEALR